MKDILTRVMLRNVLMTIVNNLKKEIINKF